MIRLFLISVFLMLSFFAQAQTTLDSLYAIWEDESQTDSTRTMALGNYLWIGFMYSDPDSAFALAEKMEKFGEDEQYLLAKAEGISYQGITRYYQGKYQESKEYFLQTLKLYEELGDQWGIANTYNNIGNIFNDQGNYPVALDYRQKSLQIFEESGDMSGVALSLANIGIIYFDQTEFEESLKFQERSLKIYEELDSKEGIARTLGNIGSIYFELKDYHKAMDYFQRGLKIEEEIDNQFGVATSLNSIGNIYSNQENYSVAIDYFQKSLEIYERLDDHGGSSSILISIGNLYNNQKRYHEALKECKKSLKLSEENGSIYTQRAACDCLYFAHKELGNNKKALGYYEQLTVLNDSVFNEDNTKKLTQLEMQYEFDKKEAAALLEQEKKDAIAIQELKQRKLERNGFIAGFAIMLLFAGIFFRQRNRINKEKERSDELLLNILPEEVAEELKTKGHSDAQLIDHVTVLFTDFKDFTKLSEQLTPNELVADLHECFSAFDQICEKYGIEKIKTIGDAYMAAGGLPFPNNTHEKDVVKASLEMVDVVEKIKTEKEKVNQDFFEVRIGVHTGPVVAGIVGVKKFQYDIWGDTVNTASRMETNGEAGKVNISQITYEQIFDDPDFIFENRGKIRAKGKGEMDMWFVSKK